MNPLFSSATLILGLFLLAAVPPVGALVIGIAVAGHMVRRARVKGIRSQMQARADERWREDYHAALRGLTLP